MAAPSGASISAKSSRATAGRLWPGWVPIQTALNAVKATAAATSQAKLRLRTIRGLLCGAAVTIRG